MTNRNNLRGFVPLSALSFSPSTPQHKVLGGLFAATASLKGTSGITTADLKQRMIATGFAVAHVAAMSQLDAGQKRQLAQDFKDGCKIVWGQDHKKLEQNDDYQGILSTLENIDGLVSPAIAASFKKIAALTEQAGTAD